MSRQIDDLDPEQQESYSDVTNWKELFTVRQKDGFLCKSIVIDADFIIGTMSYNAEKIFDEFQKMGVIRYIIKQVELELFNTKDKKLLVKRAALLNKYEFVSQDTHPDMVKSLSDIQKINAELNNHPSVTDMYISAVMQYYGGNNQTLLLTGNTKDYPYPLFKRVGYIILQNYQETRVYCLLKFNQSFFEQRTQNPPFSG